MNFYIFYMFHYIFNMFDVVTISMSRTSNWTSENKLGELAEKRLKNGLTAYAALKNKIKKGNNGGVLFSQENIDAAFLAYCLME